MVWRLCVVRHAVCCLCHVFYVLVPFLLLFVERASPLRVYEREFLLGLRKTVAMALSLHSDDQKSCNPPFLEGASADMCRLMDCFRYRMKRSRIRGKRGGVLVMQRTAQARAFAAALDGHANLLVDDFGPTFQCLSSRLRDERHSVLVAVVPSCREALSGYRTIRQHSKMRGIKRENLRHLKYASCNDTK